MKSILETKNMRLREFCLNDHAFILELLNSKGWIEYIGERHILSELEARAYLANGPLKSYQENGFGLWMVEKKDTDLPIGMCGIIKRDSLPNPDIGFAFLQDYTGRGFGFEIAAATLEFAKNNLQLSTILAITVPYNTRSIALIEKLGLSFVRSFLSEDDEELLLYSSDIPDKR